MVGETVIVRSRMKTGVDELNNPVWEDVDQEVSNVLVAPGVVHDAFASTRPDGVEVAYKLCFPKTFHGNLEHCQVNVRGEWLAVIGSPRPYCEQNCPTEWWMDAEVRRTDG